MFGVWIQYLLSTALLFAGKRFLMKKYSGKYENKHKSPVSHNTFSCSLSHDSLDNSECHTYHCRTCFFFYALYDTFIN